MHLRQPGAVARPERDNESKGCFWFGGVPLRCWFTYVLVDANLDGVPFQFVSTHLDETRSSTQALQAGEIFTELNTSNEPLCCTDQ